MTLRLTVSARTMLGAPMADTDPAVELVARAIREATDTELDDCIEDEDECFERKIHLGSEIDGVVRTVYATPEQIGRVAAAALAGRLLPPVVQTREERGWWNPRTQEVQRHWSYTTDGVPEGPRRVRTISTLADDGSPHGGATLTTAWREVSES